MTQNKIKRPAVFFDRDGTLIRDIGYLSRPSQIRIYRGVYEALRKLKQKGYWIFVVTNQSGVARGCFPESTVRRIHQVLQKQLKAQKAGVDHFYYCPHYPKGTVRGYAKICSCRKPKSGMVRKALKSFPVDPKKSYVVGDKLDDLGLAKSAKLAAGILVRTGNGRVSEKQLKKAQAVVMNGVSQAVDYILSRKG
jgi:D-glycero-D-manno-heptose 1,7-bisphosphate phosphatase